MRHFQLLVTLALSLICVSWSSAADVILNEYNAVGSDKLLDDGGGADSYFGKLEGNGGNWFELLVVGDHVDMRNWQLNWTEDETVDGGGTAAGSIVLSGHDLWSDLRAGSILTFIETTNAGFEESNFVTATDTSYDPANDDWWINIATREEQAKGADGLVMTTTNDGLPGDFSVGNDDWALTILNGSGDTVFGPAGEGAGDDWMGGGVGSTEAGSLEGPTSTEEMPVTVATWNAIAPNSDLYDDTGGTTFGAPNADFDNETTVFTPIQDIDVLRALLNGPQLGDGDFNNDGTLDAADIDALTAAVRAGSDDLTYDVNLDGSVSADDRTAWVEGVKMTYFGDSNLDGEFNSGDLVFVLGSGEYEDGVADNSTWATGDWNGDGEFDTADFVTALGSGGYEQGPRTASAAAVPEPTSLSLSVLSLLGLAACRRR